MLLMCHFMSMLCHNRWNAFICVVSKVNNIGIVSLLCHCGVTLCVTKDVTIVPHRWDALPASVSEVNIITIMSSMCHFGTY